MKGFPDVWLNLYRSNQVFLEKIADFCESKHEIPGDALGEVYEYGINVKDIKEKSL
ncbi:hypothetical protein [Desulfothermus okinawensis]